MSDRVDVVLPEGLRVQGQIQVCKDAEGWFWLVGVRSVPPQYMKESVELPRLSACVTSCLERRGEGGIHCWTDGGFVYGQKAMTREEAIAFDPQERP